MKLTICLPASPLIVLVFVVLILARLKPVVICCGVPNKGIRVAALDPKSFGHDQIEPLTALDLNSALW
jgi:hypothetical protein